MNVFLELGGPLENRGGELEDVGLGERGQRGDESAKDCPLTGGGRGVEEELENG